MWKSRKISTNTILLWLYAGFTLFVLLYLTYNSFRTKPDLLSNTFGIPERFTLENYIRLFGEQNFMRYVGNSTLILIGALLLVVVLSSMAAYGLGRFQFRGRNMLTMYFLIGLMFPVQLGIVPIFLLIRSMGLLNTHVSVILILSAGISMPVFLLTVFFARLPKDLYESAKIDGASEWTTFLRVMFPLASPVVFSICIIMSVQIWNQFFVPLLFLNSEANRTIPLLIMKYTSNLMYTMDMAMVASVAATIPVLALFYVLAQRIMDGVSSGGVKG
ncbi:carbohydrate ABC transporter permease [Paenibacillus sp. IB182496]|uniref:Carbohydrate ABC transporter permease n=1 Tax=Paenibacillus sabuli TaxID=2772509 RepID=A0A927BWY2_9BACL|nr:carbohydrate ABC transporter permease [Paenibacillus sabuli]MBD2848382.1 carbohydrate ABC transporter permease [Paenibacillus sabuli]